VSPTNAPSLQVLVPMKPLASAMTRLAPVASGPRRQALVLAMLNRVLKAAAGAAGADACCVVGGDDVVRQSVTGLGVRWVKEEGEGLNGALSAAMGHAFADGASAVIILPADLPMITADEVRRVIAASDGLTQAVGVAATRDGGTNALLIPARYAIQPAYGVDSFARHRGLIDAAGATLQTIDAPGIAFDLDTAEELAWAETDVEGFAADVDSWESWMRAGARAAANSG
jgi:2-phospho-L-lactate/phosphoenolpyruvate guanylyltransferase